MRKSTFDYIQQFWGFLFESQCATCGCPNDGDSLSSIGNQLFYVVAMVAAGGREFAVGEERQATAVLRWHDHFKAIGLQDVYCRATDTRLVIFGRAAMKIYHLASAFPRWGTLLEAGVSKSLLFVTL